MRQLPLFIIFVILMLAIQPATTRGEDRTSSYKIGAMNWNTTVVMNPVDQDDFFVFTQASTVPSINSGWIIQEIGDTVHDSTVNYAAVDGFIQTADQKGHRLSLNTANTHWQGNIAGVNHNVSTILQYIEHLDQTSITLATNVDANGQPTLDINLDIEPKGTGTLGQWLVMAAGARQLVDSHNNQTNPPHDVHVTLSAFLPAGLQSQILDDTASTQAAWAAFDTLIVMSYRNLPCFTKQCAGTSSAADSCLDGFVHFGAALANSAPAGKRCAMALELGLDGDDVGSSCWKISFGATGVFDRPGVTDPVAYRTSFLRDAMEQGWNMLTPAQQAKFHPDGAYVLHDFESLSCFRDDHSVSGNPCVPTADCSNANKCIPILYGHHYDVNLDGEIDELDLLLLQETLGTCHHDSNLDGSIDIEDLLELISRWGQCH